MVYGTNRTINSLVELDRDINHQGDEVSVQEADLLANLGAGCQQLGAV
jgi:hypothetical protein